MTLAEAAAEADALAEQGSERELAELRAKWDEELEAAARSQDFRERAVAYRAIGQFRFRQKIELLRRGLEDESPACRGSALLSLELLSRDHPGVVNGVRPLLHELVDRDDNEAVRRLAVMALRTARRSATRSASSPRSPTTTSRTRAARGGGEGRPGAAPQGRPREADASPCAAARAGARRSTPRAAAGRRRACRARSCARSAWPSISWTLRRSAPPSSRCVANEWRSRCGCTRPGSSPAVVGEPAQDQERARARQRAALRVQEELGPVAPVEVRPAAGEVAAQRLDRLPPDRDDPLLAALADHAHERGRRGRRRPSRARSPPRRAGPRRRAARRAPGRAARAASCRTRRRSAARPRPPRASAAACASGAAARPRRPGCPRARRSAAGAGRTCAPPPCAARASRPRGRRRGAGPCSARGPRASLARSGSPRCARSAARSRR